jgi:acyl-CoA dehydrogenase
VDVSRRRGRGGTVPDNPALSLAHARLTGIRAQLDAAVAASEPVLDGSAEPTMALGVELNALKVAVSDTAIEIARLSLDVCGMAGFTEQGPHSVARILRDLHSAPLMISNRRLLAANSQMLLTLRGDR